MLVNELQVTPLFTTPLEAVTTATGREGEQWWSGHPSHGTPELSSPAEGTDLIARRNCFESSSS